MQRLLTISAILCGTMAASAAAPAGAVPPPVLLVDQPIALPSNQCAVALRGVVRAYAAPTFVLDLATPTVLRVLSVGADPALLIDLEHSRTASEQFPVVMGAGLAGGDIRAGVAVPGRYRLRVLMTGDAARTGRSIDFHINLSRALESGAAEC